MAATASVNSIDLRKKNLETYSLIWLDSEIEVNKEFADAQKQLRKQIHRLKTFSDEKQCATFIQSMDKEERAIFIVNAKLGRQVIPQIHSLPQILSIYLYTLDKRVDDGWLEEFNKVSVTTSMKKLVEQVLAAHAVRNRNKVDEALSINVFNPACEKEKSTTGLNGDFVHSQLLTACLLSMMPQVTDKDELIRLSKEFYQGNAGELSIIHEFEKDYVPDRALWWYTRESFLYRLLNKALRIRDIDLLYLFRFFIHDIHEQLKQLQYPDPIRVFRGQLMSNDELQTLKSSIGQFISMNSFLSTSVDRRLALSFLSSSPASGDLQRVLFEIDLDPALPGVKPFADISSGSFFTNEKEVLIMLGSAF